MSGDRRARYTTTPVPSQGEMLEDLSEHLDTLQRMLDALYAEEKMVSRLDVIVRAEAMDLPEDVLGIITLLPPGRYRRQRLCDQLNSAIVGHGWGSRLGTVE